MTPETSDIATALVEAGTDQCGAGQASEADEAVWSAETGGTVPPGPGLTQAARERRLVA